MPLSTHDLLGRELRDSGDRSVGTITAVYRYPTDLDAPWGAAAVTHGRILTFTHLVDLQNADLDQASTVQVPHTSHTINTAPNYTPLIGDTLADDDAENVRAHYWDAATPG
ncbi:hypothetical protein DMB66_04130 [Actinoplanes sp. ATCC 53533]|uniref:hypothetical protein n=1 Tax=Actinoplanes sp. ATCC 53533 TaxID=1288362 RepID=UPI000F77FC0A|nr:hypothetical protein [Actinoplanes sp. ATCC 53533]RSM73218.1 hypothetical protein DMB66_04130 [Actinoplanes sp. ATCC 53533]